MAKRECEKKVVKDVIKEAVKEPVVADAGPFMPKLRRGFLTGKGGGKGKTKVPNGDVPGPPSSQIFELSLSTPNARPVPLPGLKPGFLNGLVFGLWSDHSDTVVCSCSLIATTSDREKEFDVTLNSAR